MDICTVPTPGDDYGWLKCVNEHSFGHLHIIIRDLIFQVFFFINFQL